MIACRSLLFAAFVAMFALTMAAPEAEPKAEAEAEAEAEPEYYYGGKYDGPHHFYYRGYNAYNGHQQTKGYINNGVNAYYGLNGYYNNYPGVVYHGYQRVY